MPSAIKTYLFTVIVFAIFAFFSFDSFSQGGNYKAYNTISSGSWTDLDSWDTKSYPDTNDLNRAIINIIEEYSIILDGNLSVKNSVSANIYNESSLEIANNLLVKNQFELFIDERGRFYVGGNVHIDAGQGGPVIGELIIDGHAEIEGDLTGNGNVSGDGYLYVGGIIGDGITIGGDVTVVCGTKASPHNLYAEVYLNSVNYSVNLYWCFDDSNPNSKGIENFLITRNDTIIGFIEYGSKSSEYSFVDNGLEAGARPVYKVYAVYEDNLMSKPAIKSFENDPLPIELIFFIAKANEKNVMLEWATAAEINNNFFTIERSTDGKNWTIIGYEQGAGNSNHTKYYEFIDKNPVEGVSYYRLKQTDYDGQFEYFEPVAVNFIGIASELQILNVRNSNSELNIVVSCRDFNTNLLVADLQGRILFRQNIESSPNAQEININLNRSYYGDVIIIRLYSSNNSDQRKVMVL